MSQTEAIARAQDLRASLLDHGVSKVSIELVAGRGSGGWSDDRFVATLGHHILSRRSQGMTPLLSLVKKGRANLPGPLCNGYGGWDEVARIVCMGWANHPGQGGPVTVEAGVIPANNGRPYLFGWEFEGGILASDWTDSFREFMGRCHAGTLAWLGRTEKSHLEHKDWARPIGRKVDRLGYDLASARREAATYLGDEMVRRSDKADDGLAMHKPSMTSAVQAGAFSTHTQPGGVAFNDEIAAFMNRLGLLDFQAVVSRLNADNAQLRQEIQILTNEVSTIVAGSGGDRALRDHLRSGPD